ncbi:MAG TPA: lipopolysaccharide biosynthesis protein [Bacteroidaceae bacterium]|nr:lipopolysaccharide biosynthesis protein [Bacteroidaceae bacterium]
MNQSKNKQIAKNTIYLYIRMLLIVLVGLYTSRIILQQLGVVDYGIYNVVGGLVAMFSMMSNAVSSSTTRFLAFEIEGGAMERLQKVFSTSLTINHILALAIIVVAECVGPWFLTHHLTIPPDRLMAAHVVFQCAVLSFGLSLIMSTYHGLIIAHEKMSFYAYMGILEVVLKCAIALMLSLSLLDKLMVYSVLLLGVQGLLLLLYMWHCRRYYGESRYILKMESALTRQMTSFAGWNMIGSSSLILRSQGVNIVINIFCGPVINAARGISFQVNSMVTQFNSSFMSATNPQIIKLYAEGERKQYFTLIERSAKFSFFLLLMLSTPLIIECPFVLDLWLDKVPAHSVPFVQLMLIFTLFDSFSIPLYYGVEATGRIKWYQLIVGTIQLLNLPISYLLLAHGFAPESTIVVYSILAIICLFPRVYILQHLTNFPAHRFLTHVFLRNIVAGLISLSGVWGVAHYCPDNGLGFMMVLCASIVWVAVVILYIGCSSEERKVLYAAAYKFWRKIVK